MWTRPKSVEPLNRYIVPASVLLLWSPLLTWLDAAQIIEADICVYGGSAGGVAAAVQAARMGKRAVIAEFGNHLGGMSSGGLGATDIGNKAAIGGIAREFYHRVSSHYAKDDAWRFERREDYFQHHGSRSTLASNSGTSASPTTRPRNFSRATITSIGAGICNIRNYSQPT